MGDGAAPADRVPAPQPGRAGPAAGGVTRRRLLVTAGAAFAGGAAVAAVGEGIIAANREQQPVVRDTAQTAGQDTAAEQASVGEDSVPFHGPHQAGIGTAAQAHAVFCAFDLRDGIDAAGLGKLLRILTDDAVRVTAGRPALGDTAPELASTPARLTVTAGQNGRPTGRVHRSAGVRADRSARGPVQRR